MFSVLDVARSASGWQTAECLEPTWDQVLAVTLHAVNMVHIISNLKNAESRAESRRNPVLVWQCPTSEHMSPVASCQIHWAQDKRNPKASAPLKMARHSSSSQEGSARPNMIQSWSNQAVQHHRNLCEVPNIQCNLCTFPSPSASTKWEYMDSTCTAHGEYMDSTWAVVGWCNVPTFSSRW